MTEGWPHMALVFVRSIMLHASKGAPVLHNVSLKNTSGSLWLLIQKGRYEFIHQYTNC